MNRVSLTRKQSSILLRQNSENLFHRVYIHRMQRVVIGEREKARAEFSGRLILVEVSYFRISQRLQTAGNSPRLFLSPLCQILFRRRAAETPGPDLREPILRVHSLFESRQSPPSLLSPQVLYPEPTSTLLLLLSFAVSSLIQRRLRDFFFLSLFLSLCVSLPLSRFSTLKCDQLTTFLYRERMLNTLDEVIFKEIRV